VETIGRGLPDPPEASPSWTGKANSRTFLGSSALYLRAYSPTHSSDLSTTLCALCSVRCLSGSKDLRWDSARYRPFSSSSDSAASDGGSYNAAAAKRFDFLARRGRRSLAEGIRREIARNNGRKPLVEPVHRTVRGESEPDWHCQSRLKTTERPQRLEALGHMNA